MLVLGHPGIPRGVEPPVQQAVCEPIHDAIREAPPAPMPIRGRASTDPPPLFLRPALKPLPLGLGVVGWRVHARTS